MRQGLRGYDARPIELGRAGMPSFYTANAPEVTGRRRRRARGTHDTLTTARDQADGGQVVSFEVSVQPLGTPLRWNGRMPGGRCQVVR